MTLNVSAHAQSRREYRALKVDGYQARWQSNRADGGVTLSYALLRDDGDFTGATNCRRMTPVRDALAGNHIPSAEFERALIQSLRAWEAVANIEFTPARDPRDADIVFGANTGGRGWAFADVLIGATPLPAIIPAERSGGDDAPAEARAITRALVCLNPTRRWKVGFGGDPRAYDLRRTLTHEIGHALGLDHPRPRGLVMSFVYDEDFATPRAGDAAGAGALYGPPVATHAAKMELASRPAGDRP